MANIEGGYWAVYPVDDVTHVEFEGCVDALRALSIREKVAGLHSPDAVTRKRAIYEVIDPIFKITKSVGGAVEIPVDKDNPQFGRAFAAFILKAEKLEGFTVNDLKIFHINFVALSYGLGISLYAYGDDPSVMRQFAVPLNPEKEGAHLTYVDTSSDFGNRTIINSCVGDILMPEELDLVESILVIAPKAALKALAARLDK